MSDPRIGTVLAGKYRIDAPVGRGGMGTIYRATHLMLGKPVAVKLINPELGAAPETAARFEREARAASQLQHPNIAAVYDLGQAEDGTLYIAMELVDGDTLKAAIAAGGPMAAARIVRLAGQVAAALGAAHRAGIVHRDLKPQNIMIATGADGREVAKLLDFGIAKTLDGATALTATGLSIGTPHYMSPEQGTGTPVDARSDIYSFGVILYEMLTGEVPFDAPSAPAVLVKHMTEQPVPPSERPGGLDVPHDLEAVVLKCLEKDPAARFQSAEELGVAIEAAGAASPKSAGAGRMRKMPGAMDAKPEPAGDLAGAGAGPVLPPRSALRNLTSVGGSDATALPTAAAADSRAAGSSVLLVVMLLVLIGGVGFAAYGLGYFSSTAGDETATPATVQAAVDTAAVPAAAAGTAPGRETATPAPTPAPPAALQPPAASLASPEASPARGQAAAPIQAVAEARPQTTVEAPPQPDPPRPEHPSVRFGCDGPVNVCAAIQAALDDTLARASMPSVSDETRAEVLVDALVAEGQPTVQESFGTTFVIQPYTVSLSGVARRSSARVPMPEPRTFSLDERVGQARLAEQARLIASSIVERIRAYWARLSSLS